MTEPGSPSTPPPAPAAPQPQPAQKKGLGAVGWIAIGCLALVLLGFGSCVVIGMFAKKKMSDVAEKFEKNPAMASAEMVVRMNPELEMVSKDEDAGTMTIREKKTGKTMTLNVADIKQGKIRFTTDEGQDVSMQMNEGGLQVKHKDASGEESSTTLGGAESSKLPDWLSAYPGSSTAGGMRSSGPEGASGTVTFSTDASVDEVASYYKDALESEGFEVTRRDMSIGNTVSASLSAKSEDTGRTAQLTASHSGDENKTAIVINYSESSKAD